MDIDRRRDYDGDTRHWRQHYQPDPGWGRVQQERAVRAIVRGSRRFAVLSRYTVPRQFIVHLAQCFAPGIPTFSAFGRLALATVPTVRRNVSARRSVSRWGDVGETPRRRGVGDRPKPRLHLGINPAVTDPLGDRDPL